MSQRLGIRRSKAFSTASSRTNESCISCPLMFRTPAQMHSKFTRPLSLQALATGNRPSWSEQTSSSGLECRLMAQPRTLPRTGVRTSDAISGSTSPTSCTRPKMALRPPSPRSRTPSSTSCRLISSLKTVISLLIRLSSTTSRFR